MSTITAVIDGTTHTVELAKVTAMEAVQYRMETGLDLDLAVLTVLERGDVLTCADLALVKWLWVRQQADPLVHFSVVARTVTLFPADDTEVSEPAAFTAEG